MKKNKIIAIIKNELKLASKDKLNALDEEAKILLLPVDENDNKNVIIHIYHIKNIWHLKF